MNPVLPPLSLSTGPAISGAPNESAGWIGGDFIFKRGDDWSTRIRAMMPMILAGAAIWLVLKK